MTKQPMFDLCSGGLETEQEYPYDAVDEKCKFKKSEAVVYVNGSVSISKDETSELPLHNFCQFANLLQMYCTCCWAQFFPTYLWQVCSRNNLAKVHYV